MKRSVIGDPFAGFSGFNDCVGSIMEKNPKLKQEDAIKICVKLKEKKKDDISANTHQNIKTLASAIISECDDEELRKLPAGYNVNLKDIILQTMSSQIDDQIKELLNSL
jgi:hypothetical protein